MSNLFEPIRVGAIALANRIVMAPLTRNRAWAAQVPSDLAVTYYAQRASAGLVITEASQISPTAQGYLDTPGISFAADFTDHCFHHFDEQARTVLARRHLDCHA